MKNISGMDYDNTPFSIPAQMIRGSDEPEYIVNPFSSANRRNIDGVVANINLHSGTMDKAIKGIEDEISNFTIDEEIETVVLHADSIKRILSLVENLRLSFNSLVSSAE